MKVCPVCERRFDDGPLHCPLDGAALVVVPASRPDPMLGRVLGERYRVVRRIGEGGMGCVYEANHATLGRRYAIKVLRPELFTDVDAITRFRREAIAAGGIEHPNIVAVLDVGQNADGTAFLVMEYLEGTELRHVLQEVRVLPTDRCIHIFLQICEAAGVAHARGIVHRDLKPENIVLVRVGTDPDHVKVLDFGVSKLTAPGQKLTRTGFALGTPEYMSPEQALGQTDVDHRTDIYAIGAMLYEAVTGRAPITGNTPTEVLARLFTEIPAPVRQLNPGVAPALEAIILRAIDKDRDRRFESCAALSAALASLSAQSGIAFGMTIQATPVPPSPGSLPAPTPGTSPTAASVPLPPPQPVRAAPSESVRSVGSILVPGAQPAPVAASGPPRRSRVIPAIVAAVLAAGVAATAVALLTRGGSATDPADTELGPRRARTGAGSGDLPAWLTPLPAKGTADAAPAAESAGVTGPEAAVTARPEQAGSPTTSVPPPLPGPSSVGIRASSEFPHHEAVKAMDGTSDTAWGVRGDPAGQWIEIMVAPPAPLRAVWVQSGYVKIASHGLDVFTANRRLRDVEVMVTGADGEAFRVPHTFEDSRAWHALPLPGPNGLRVSTVRITIRRVYEGVRWKDTHVSEILVDVDDGRPPMAPPVTVATGTPGPDDLKAEIPPCPAPGPDPEGARELLRQGLALRGSGRAAKTLETFEAAVRADPSFGLAQNNLAYVQLGLGNRFEGLHTALLAVACLPRRSSAWMHLGDAYVQNGDDRRALMAYDLAVANASRDTQAILLRKGNLLWMMGDREAANAAWQVACDAGNEPCCQRIGVGVRSGDGTDWRNGWGTWTSVIAVASP
ncbi:MAG: protein kinase [Myxococcota bacterium]|nr:protein kinase [Myxococcota bacterium]